MKKFISVLLTAALATTMAAGLAACGEKTDGGEKAKYEYDITVWVGEDMKTLTETLITDFNTTNTNGIKFNATVNEQSESNASGAVLAKPDSAPEIFCFAQDQIARLVESKLLASPSASGVSNVKATHTELAVAAATVGNTVYAYPLTEDNGYFLYYDKSVISDEQAGSVESIVAQCVANNKYFSVDLSGGWYLSSFFYAAGAKSEWTTNDQGKFTKYDDDFNSDKGYIAAQGIYKVSGSTRYLPNGKASDFNAATPAAAVISGVWDYNTAKTALKENLGIAKLPKYTVGDKDYQLASYLGSKLLGVTPQDDANKSAALSLLAQHLTGADAQLKRYEQFGWGPSAKAAQENAAVKADVALTALKASATVPQGQYPANWWSKMSTLGTSIEKSKGSETALKNALSVYEQGLVELIEA